MSWQTNRGTTSTTSSSRPKTSYNVSSTDESSTIRGCCYKWRVVIGITSGVALFIFALLMGLSFQYVEPGEIGLPKDRVTGDVDEDGRVYRMNLHENGRYAVGPSVVFEIFDNRIHQYTGSLDVVASNSRGFTLTIACFYRLIEDELGELFTKYNTEWTVPVTNQILETVKSKAPEFNIDEYITDLENIRQQLAEVVRNDLRILHVETVDMELLILNCDFTEEVDAQYLRSVVQEQNNERQLIQRRVDIIVQDTETQRREIVANTTLVSANGAAEAERITQTAQAEAEAITELAHTAGFTLLFDHFNVTDPNDKTSFLEWLAISGNSNIRLLVGIDSALVNIPAP